MNRRQALLGGIVGVASIAAIPMDTIAAISDDPTFAAESKVGRIGQS